MSRLSAVSVTLLIVVGCGSSEVVSTTEPGENVASTTVDLVASTTTTRPGPMTITSAGVAPSSTTLAPSSTSTTQVPPVEQGVVLRADGVGVASFGDTFATFVDILEVVLGTRTLSEEVEPTSSPSLTELVVYWEEADLRIGFSTHPIYRSDGQLHFTWWSIFTTTPPTVTLKTAEGVGWGSTMSDLADAYGDRFWVNSWDCAPPGIIVPEGDVPGTFEDESGLPRWIFVGFDQPGQWTEDGSRYFDSPGSTRVAYMRAGVGEGC